MNATSITVKKANNNNDHFARALANAEAAVRQLSAEGITVDSISLDEPLPVILLLRAPSKGRFMAGYKIIRPKRMGGREAQMVTFINQCKVSWWEDFE